MFQRLKNGVTKALRSLAEVLGLNDAKQKVMQLEQEAIQRQLFIAGQVASMQDTSPIFAQCCIAMGFVPDEPKVKDEPTIESEIRKKESEIPEEIVAEVKATTPDYGVREWHYDMPVLDVPFLERKKVEVLQL